MADFSLRLVLKAENGQFVAQLRNARGDLLNLGAAGRSAGDEIDRGMGRARESTSALARQLRDFRNGVLTYFGVREVLQFGRALLDLADTYKSGQASLSLYTRSQTEFASAQRDTFDIAQRTRSALQDTQVLYGKFSDSVRGLGGNQQQTAAITEAVTQSLKISGASAANTSAAILQLSQALASGALRGDEFNSIMENAPRLARALADSLKVPVGALRQMAEEGKLTSEVVAKALLEQRNTIAAEFEKLPITVRDAAVKVANAFQVEIGQRLGGTSASIAKQIAAIADHIGEITQAIIELGKVVAAVLLGRMAGALSGLAIKLAQQLILWRAATAAAAEMGIAIGGATTAMQLFGRVVSLAGGWIGIAVTALTTLYFWFQRNKQGAEDAAKGVQRSADDILSEIEQLKGGQTTIGLAGDLDKLRAAGLQAANAINSLKPALDAALREGRGNDAAQLAAAIDVQQQRLARLTEAAKTITGQGGVDAPLQGTAPADPQLAKFMQDLRDDEFQHFQKMLKDEIDLLEKQADARRTLQADLLEAEGRDFEAALARLTAEWQDNLKLMGDSAEGVDLANRLFDAQKSKLAADQVIAQAERIQQRLQQRTAGRQVRAETASPSESAAIGAEQRRDYQEADEALLALILNAQEFSGPVGDQLRARLQEIALDLRSMKGPADDWRAALLEVANTVTGPVRDAIAGTFKKLMDGSIRSLNDLGRAARDVASTFVDAIQQMIAKSLAFYAVQQLIGLATGGKYTTNAQGIIVAAGKAHGGPIEGPGGPTDDRVPIWASNGEYVLRAAAVRRVGRSFLDALNAGFMPPSARNGFAGGGLVGGSAAAAMGIQFQIINTGEPMKVQRTEHGQGTDGRELYRVFVEPMLAHDIATNGPITQKLSGALGLSRNAVRR